MIRRVRHDKDALQIPILTAAFDPKRTLHMRPREFRPEAYLLGSKRDGAIERLLSDENVDVALFRLAGRTHISAGN